MPVHLACGQLALCRRVYSVSALINRHNMVDRTPENVVRCLGGTSLPSDTISTTPALISPPPSGVFTAVFSSRQISTAVYLFHPLSLRRSLPLAEPFGSALARPRLAAFLRLMTCVSFKINVFVDLCIHNLRIQEEGKHIAGIFYSLSNLSI